MKRSTIVAVSALLTVAVAWSAYGQAGGGGGRGRGGFGMMGPRAQKAVADLQEQVTKLKTIIDANAKAMEGGFQNMSEDDRAKMKERSTEGGKIMAAIQADVDQLRLGQMAREYNQFMTALKDAQASAQKENAKETAQKLGEIIAERQKEMEQKVTAMGMTMDDLEKMGARGGGRRGQ
jgi:hypothetical protein